MDAGEVKGWHMFAAVATILLPPFSAGPPVSLGSLVVTRQALWIIGITLLAVLLLWLFFNRTMIGRGLRACALNPTGRSRSLGVPPTWPLIRRYNTSTWAMQSPPLMRRQGDRVAPSNSKKENIA
jgi:branched-subunit amino acid ABC-type transport system permease component